MGTFERKAFIAEKDREALLSGATMHGRFILASGIEARQKFDFDQIATDSELFEIAVKGLARCINESFEDYNAIITVARGATRLGAPLAKILRSHHIMSAYSIDNYGNRPCYTIPPKKNSAKLFLW